jgi:pimeloyl-ACP methyl ester carboxylesterase
MRHIIAPGSLFLAALLMIAGVQAQLPVNNPTGTTYKKDLQWTNSLHWKNVVLANDIPQLIDDNNVIDSSILARTLSNLSAKGGVLYFSSGTYYFTTDLVLPAGVIIRGELAAGAQTNTSDYERLTKFVFPRLILARSQPPKSREPFSLKPKCISYNGSADGFTGLVNIDINRAAICIGDPLHPAGNVLLYGIRQNNAAMLDPAIPTSTQINNRQGWQIWPNGAIGNINVFYSGHCLVAGSVLNDAVTDNIFQWDYMTDDGMRFDGSRAEFRFTAHPGVVIQPVNGKTAPATISGNTVYASKGYQPLIAPEPVLQADNRFYTVTEKENIVNDGKSAITVPYNLLYKDEVVSESRIFVSEYNDSLPYRLIKPANYDPSRKYPLVVFLHDFWERGSDNKRQLRQFIWQLTTPENRAKYPCFIVAPQLPQSEPKWKTDGLGSETWPIQCNSGIINELINEYSIDSKRVYATGNSMGGAGAINLAIQHPDQIAAVVGISVFYRLTKNSALQINKIPIWLIYGENDEKIEPIVKQSIRTDLKTAQAVYKYTEIPKMGHRCWNDVSTEVPDLLAWLFSQHK